jgi:hypothetical protein
MTKITWLGEDTETYAGPSFIVWKEIKFPKDVAVEVTDEYMIRKATAAGRFFKVTEEEKPTEATHETETKIEDKVEEQVETVREDQRQSEKTGYSPVKKKTRSRKKPKPDAIRGGIPAPDA